MLSTAIVIFREVIEIAMIVGIMLAATRGLHNRMPWIIAGFAGGALGAGLIALSAEAISAAMEGMGQELFNAAILFTAAIFIGWTVVWMKKHAKELSVHIHHVGKEVAAGKSPLYTLSIIIGLALLREGAEIVLFIYGMILSGQTAVSIISGSMVGFGFGLTVGVLLYYGLLKMQTRQMLRVTGWLLVLLVAGLASQGAGYLSAAGYFSSLSNIVWDSSWLLTDDSIAGKTLHSLIGYTAQPMAIQIIFYLATLLGLVIVINFSHGGNKRKGFVAATAMVLLIACSLIAPMDSAETKINAQEMLAAFSVSSN